MTEKQRIDVIDKDLTESVYMSGFGLSWEESADIVNNIIQENPNYIKVDEGSVVLTKQELQELKYKTDWLNSEKMHLQGELEYTEFELSCAHETNHKLGKLYKEATEKLKKYNEFNNNLIVENQKLKDELTIARKDTAKEIFVAISKLATYDDGWNEMYYKDHIDELAKQYGAEVE